MAIVKINPDKPAAGNTGIFFSAPETDGFVICKSPDKLKALVSALGPLKTVHYISDGDWSMHDLVMQLLPRYAPAELFITTYALRKFSMRQLILAQESKQLTTVSMLLDARAKTRTPEVYQLASFNLNRIRLTSIHAKVTVIRSLHGCVTILGSANWTTNPRIEAGVVSLEKTVADFHIGWIEKVMDNAEIFS